MLSLRRCCLFGIEISSDEFVYDIEVCGASSCICSLCIQFKIIRTHLLYLRVEFSRLAVGGLGLSTGGNSGGFVDCDTPSD
jgi:hypothetical protein